MSAGMFSLDDTIVAIATPPGRGGIGIVRLSGMAATRVAASLLIRRRPLTPRYATLSRVAVPLDASGEGRREPIDHVLATYFPRPGSYTGEDVVELSAHGSPPLLRLLLGAAVGAGARLANPGEFTLRAFLNGRLDLVQAESVSDLINAVTPEQVRVAFDQLEGTLTGSIAEVERALFDLIAGLEASLDFPDEGYHFIDESTASEALERMAQRVAGLIAEGTRGRALREGRQVVLTGRSNVGKSSIFNRLLGFDRAIVTEKPGTTRDLVTEETNLEGVPISLVDTAGIRPTEDEVEHEGMRLARAAGASADVTVVVLDQSSELTGDDWALVREIAPVSRVLVRSKVDLPAAWGCDVLGAVGRETEIVAVSTVTAPGVGNLKRALAARLGAGSGDRDTPAVTNARHLKLLTRALEAIRSAGTAAGQHLSEEFVLADLQRARGFLEEITGRRAPDAVLKRIFEQFCIGK